MWYNNERDHKSIYYADSRDLVTWEDKSKAVGDQPGEGPKVFRWHDYYWMLTDVWNGLAVYRSEDAVNWRRQKGGNLLEAPGVGTDDQVKGGHPDVVVSGGRAYLFYFTHPGRRGPDADKDGFEQRRSSIQVAELHYKKGRLSCNRDVPTWIKLIGGR
jgi:beta-xylosidase